MSNTSQTLIDIQFQHIGEWSIGDYEQLYHNLTDNGILNRPNVLYSFVIKSNETDIIGYIGKTSKSLKNRFQGYMNPGQTQTTNIRVSAKIKESLNGSNRVLIYALFDIEPLQWGSFSINIPAGIEDSIVHKLKPLWNIAGVQATRIVTSTEALEEETVLPLEILNDTDEILAFFKIKLGEAYYNNGIMNPGVKATDYLGNHNDPVELFLPGNITLRSTINRTANTNSSVRIHFGSELSDWYHQHKVIGNELTAFIKSGNRIIIE